MRVLLLSPLPGLDPPCGDVTYTQTLLANPPAQVDYESYSSAIARGALREHGTRGSLAQARRARRGLLSEAALIAVTKPINSLRKARRLFWEPFRFFSVKRGEYDLIHMHVFSSRFFGLEIPLVVSNAAPLRYLYSEARGYSSGCTNIMERLEIILGRSLGVNLNSYWLPQASRVIAFTDYLRDWYVRRNIFPKERIDVVPIFLPSASVAPAPICPRRIGFIAKDFEAKGGRTVLQAYEQVRAVRPDAQLTVVGSPERLDPAEAARKNITWLPYVPREELLREVLPSFDVLAYPTNFDGLPLVVLETMAQGVPVATSDYQAMPELMNRGECGLISPVLNAEALAVNLLYLLEPAHNRHYRSAALSRFETTYSADVVRPRLRACYEAAIAAPAMS